MQYLHTYQIKGTRLGKQIAERQFKKITVCQIAVPSMGL